METIRHEPYQGAYEEVIVTARIVHLQKTDSSDNALTEIHLDTGEILLSENSIKTLEARINSSGQ